MEIDYPDLEVIAADDRSQDSTGRILDEFAAAHPRLGVVHITQLTSGWLGNLTPSRKAYEASTGEWLPSRSDVCFKNPMSCGAPLLWRKRTTWNTSRSWANVEMVGFAGAVLITFFGHGV